MSSDYFAGIGRRTGAAWGRARGRFIERQRHAARRQPCAWRRVKFDDAITSMMRRPHDSRRHGRRLFDIFADITHMTHAGLPPPRQARAIRPRLMAAD